MRDRIIQITEENLRKAVEANDLKLLAPEVFEKKKVIIKMTNVKWHDDDVPIFPTGVLDNNDRSITSLLDLLNKPPMTMILEWEE